ncbi:MAG: hypothetical protein QOK40_2291 [Miltoncostaeaceae bacterium]|nr:hypothetical protein [Miltoncostaeaceae bacterium]
MRAGRPTSAEPDPDALLAALREAAGPPPLPPLSLPEPSASARGGAAGAVVTLARRAVLRLIAPELHDLMGQLERDRHRERAELQRLEERVARLVAGPADQPGRGAPAA